MPPENDNQSGVEGGESLTNVKAEFSRKLSNIEAKYAAVESTNAQLMATLKSMAEPKSAPVAQSKLEDVWFDKPNEAASRIKQEAKAEVMQEINAQNSRIAKQNDTLSQLVAEFPELSDGNHDLTKKAVEIYANMSSEDKTSPLAYKAAVREAASDLSIMPKSKRKYEDDDYSISGGGSSSVRSERPRSDRGGIDKATEEFARLVGVDIDDPKVKERIKSKHNRRTYNKWE